MSVPEILVSEVIAKIDRGEPFLLLDVRNDEEFALWKLEGRSPVETLHVPYFDFIEDGESSLGRVPRDGREIIVLCAKGGSSELVASMLSDAGISAKNVAGGMLAYGEYLQPTPVPLRPDEAERFEIWQVNRRGKGCLSYVIRSRAEAIVVDASRRVEWYETFVRDRGAHIVRVMDTHVHADHLSGGPALAQRNAAPYFVAAGGDFEMKLHVMPAADGEVLWLGGPEGVCVEFRILATPGHTPGSTSYWIGRRYLLTGDTLFVGGVGRPDLGGHVEAWGRALYRTLRDKFAPLDDDTVILPAHYADATESGPDGVVSGNLGVLRRSVPELQIDSEESFVESMRAGERTPPASYAEIIRANLGLAAASGEKATEWELGKNECAASRRHA